MSSFRRPVAVLLSTGTGGGGGGGTSIVNVDATTSVSVYDSDSDTLVAMLARNQKVLTVDQALNFSFGINDSNFSPSSKMVVYAEDGDFLRLIKTINGATSRFFIDGNDDLQIYTSGANIRFGASNVQIARASLYIDSQPVLSSAAQLNYTIAVPGTGSATRALVLDGNRNIGNINVISADTLMGTLSTGSQPFITSLDVVNISSLSLNNGIINATANELNWLHGATPGFVKGRSVMIADSSSNIKDINVLQASELIGTLKTSSQPHITSIGTLDSLYVSTTIGVGTTTPEATIDIVAARASLRLFDGASSMTISMGLITSSSDIKIANGRNLIFTDGSISGLNALTATSINGTIQTAAQPNITSIGALSSLNITGDLLVGTPTEPTAGSKRVTIYECNGQMINLIRCDNALCRITLSSLGDLELHPTRDISILNGGIRMNGNITGVYELTASTLTGTLQTAAQPNITSIGALDSLQVVNSITASTISASQLSGTLQTASQPAITSIGTLSTLSVQNGIYATSVSASQLTGVLQTAAQPAITSIGTLVSLSVQNAISGSSITADTLTGVLQTAIQPNISSIGTLSNLSVNGSITAGSVSTGTISGVLQTASQPNITSIGTLSSLDVSNSINVNTVQAFTLIGTLQTSAQPNIRSVGTLDSLRVAADISAASISVNDITGTLQTAHQLNITRVGILNDLQLGGALGIGVRYPSYAVDINTSQLGIVKPGIQFSDGVNTASIHLNSNSLMLDTSWSEIMLGMNVDLRLVGGRIVGLSDITANTLTGVIQTPSQPLITELGALNTLQVAHLGIGSPASPYSINVLSSDNTMMCLSNGSQLLTLRSDDDIYTINTSNNKLALGQHVDLVLNEGTIIGLDSLSATAINGTIHTAHQPYITSLGALTSLTVDGALSAASADIAGDTHIRGDLHLTGALNLSTPLTFTSLTSASAVFDADIDATSFLNGGTLTVTGGATFSRSVYVGTDLIVANQITIGDTIITEDSLSALSNLTPGIATANTLLLTNGDNNLTGFATLSATTLGGTLSSSYQPNITTIGNLSALNVSGFLGVGTTAPLSQVDISSSTGNCLRLTYNKSTSVYARLYLDSVGNTTIAAPGTLKLIGDDIIVPNVRVGNTMNVDAPLEVGYAPVTIYTKIAFNNAANNHSTYTPPAGGTTYNYSIRTTGKILCFDSIDLISDRRTKKNIEALSDEFCSNFIEYTTPVKFNWIKGSTHKSYGYIAQDLIRAGYSDLVSLINDDTAEEVIDDDGFISPAGIRFTVSYQHVIPILAKNQKRLMQENAELRAKLDAIISMLSANSK